MSPRFFDRDRLVKLGIVVMLVFLGFTLTRTTLVQAQSPAVQLRVPATAPARGHSAAIAEYSLPIGARRVWHARIRVLDSNGELTELLPMHPDRERPGLARRRLRTDSYPPGVYQVRAEVEYRDAGGESATAVSDFVPMAVLPRSAP